MGNESDIHAADESSTSNATMITAIGLSALAAFAVAASLVVLRRRQQNARRRGERIPLPEGSVAATEAAVWETADVATTTELDLALRALADHCRTTHQPLPTLMGVNLAPGAVVLALASPVDLPSPWVHDAAGSWSVNPHDLTAAHTAISPYPALVAVGSTDAPTTTVDVDDEVPPTSTLLLNLEHFGHLAVAAPDPRVAVAAVRSIAWELALSPLADDLRVTLVGFGADMPHIIDSGRVDYAADADTILDRLARTTTATAGILAAQDLESMAPARTAYSTSEMTAPHIILLAEPLTAAQHDRLNEIRNHHPRLAFAAVTAAHDPTADWTLHLADPTNAQLTHAHSSLTIPITPQLITAAGHQDLIDLHAVALEDPQPPTVPTIAWTADEIDDTLATHPTDILTPLPVVDAPELHLEHDHEADLPDLSAHVWIHMLGRPSLTPLSGAQPPEQRGPLLTELAVLLSIHADTGISHTDVDAKIWPKSKIDKIRDDHERNTKKARRRNEAFSRLRSWLGATAAGDEAFPKVGDRSGRAKYRLHPDVVSDWDRWHPLLNDHPAYTSTPRLAAAVDLVTGQPLSGVSPARYGWASHLQQELISTLTDAAEELAARYIHLGDLPAAALTADRGLKVDSAHEGLWRLAIIAAHAQGDRAQAQRHIDTMLAEMADLEVDLHDETITLLRELAKARDDDGDRQYDIAS